jgi:hypothetical protein
MRSTLLPARKPQKQCRITGQSSRAHAEAGVVALQELLVALHGLVDLGRIADVLGAVGEIDCRERLGRVLLGRGHVRDDHSL